MSSPGSFYSTNSHPEVTPRPVLIPALQTGTDGLAEITPPYAASRDEGVRDWLQQSENQHLLERIAQNVNIPPQSNSGSHGNGHGPPLTDPDLENATKTFHEMCQKRRLESLFEIHDNCNVGFVGTLDVAGRHFEVTQAQRSKKLVKVELINQAFQWVQNQSVPVTNAPTDMNWIGMLQEKLVQLVPTGEPSYAFQTCSLATFRCTVTLPDLSGSGMTEQRFSSGPEPHPNKKIAKTLAAKAAVLEMSRAGLIAVNDAAASDVLQRGLLPGTGPPSYTSHLPTNEVPVSGSAGGVDLSHCRLLAELATRERLPPPKYDLQVLESSLPAHYSGSVYFPHTLVAGEENFEAGGPIGSVENVFGRQKAKEELARQVLPIVQRYLESLRGRMTW